ncbi:MAG TPA: LamG-like jellyroll fold domain-containing protein, partial [Methanoregula sp.]|nr:LamG-like jellyroll fold domain-containing protein [Methanoregula sp.]
DGTSAKIYLDGALRNRANATGPLHYEYQNSVLLGADAGEGETPDTACPRFLRGGLDDVRIYDAALTYSEVMEDRFRCSAEPGKIPRDAENESFALPSCLSSSGSLVLAEGQSASRTLLFSNMAESGTWSVSVPPGSVLVVKARDLYFPTYPDAWYVEIADGDQRVDRSIAFPGTNNAPVDGTISSGNATVTIRYYDGKYRFPASVEVIFESRAAPPLPVQVIPKNILANTGIVIYSASWATLIAVLVVVVWLHRRKVARRAASEKEISKNPGEPEEKEK